MPTANGVLVKCHRCGKEIYRPQWWLKRQSLHFCDSTCRGAWQSTQVGPAAPAYKGTQVQVQCSQCGKQIERNPARVGTTERKVHFCCKDCKHKWLTDFMSGPTSPNWKGGVVKYYGPNWHRQKRLARKRDNNTCRVCGATQKKNGKALDVHHVTPFRSFNYVPGENDNYVQANDLSNLVCLCMKCHRKVEHGVIALQPNLL